MPPEMTSPGSNILIKEIPEDLMLDSSYLSAISPKTITLLSRTVSGNALGISAKAKYPMSSKKSKIPYPLPKISSICFHSVCMMSTNSTMKKDNIQGPIKPFINNLSNTGNFKL